MNKTLCVTAFAALFFSATCAERTLPDYSMFPTDYEKYCNEFDTEKCREFAIFIKGLANVPHLTPKERKRHDTLHQLLTQEKEEKEGDIVTIKDNTQKETEPVIINQITK